MPDPIFHRSTAVAPAYFVDSVLDDRGYPDRMVGQFKRAYEGRLLNIDFADPYPRSAETSLRVADFVKALADAGLYDDLLCYVPPDISLIESGMVRAAYDLSPNQNFFGRAATANVPSTDVGSGLKRTVLSLPNDELAPTYLVAILPGGVNGGGAEFQHAPGLTIMAVVNHTTVDGSGSTERNWLGLMYGTGTQRYGTVGTLGGQYSARMSRTAGGTQSVATGSVRPTAGEWHVEEVTVDFSTGTITHYEDGSSTATDATMGAGDPLEIVPSSVFYVRIGHARGNNAGVQLSDVLIWPRVLDGAERTAARALLADINPQIPAS